MRKNTFRGGLVLTLVLVFVFLLATPVAAENVSEKNIQLEELDIGWETKYQTSVDSNQTNYYETSRVKDMTGKDEVTIEVGTGENGFAFDPPGVAVSTGTTVIWEWTGEGGAHNVVSEDGSDYEFESELTDEAGYTIEQTVDEAGAVLYVCIPHRAQGMYGAIAVVDNYTVSDEVRIDNYLSDRGANLYTSRSYLNDQDQFFTGGIYVGPGEKLTDYDLSETFGYQWVRNMESQETAVSYRVFSGEDEKIVSSVADLDNPEQAKQNTLDSIEASNIESDVSGGNIYEKGDTVTLVFVSDGYLVDMRYSNSNMTTGEKVEELEKYAQIVNQSGSSIGDDSLLVLLLGGLLIVGSAIYYRKYKDKKVDYV